VALGDQEVQLLVTAADDAAMLVLGVKGEAGSPGYIPLFASTFRGIPAVTVDILAAKAGDAIWVQSSWPGNEVLAYYRLGEGAAMTGFGELALLTSPLPQSLSGGAVAFPAYDPQGVQKLASFYLQ
jgi:hypothetical protein